MAIAPPSERVWWNEPVAKTELVWMLVAFVWGLIMFFMMIYWHIAGGQNVATETYMISVERYIELTQAVVDKYTVREEDGFPVVRPPPGSDVYLIGRALFPVAYQISDDTNAFVRWSTGYRSGGYNGEIYNNPYEEETMEQWEIGLKSDLVPGTLRLNTSVFQFEYHDMQVSQIQVINNQVTSFIGNAGKAERWGAEVEMQWSPLDNLLVALSYTHLGGNFDEFPKNCGTGTNANNCINKVNYAQRAISPDNGASLVTDWVFAQTDWAEFMAHLEVFWQQKVASSTAWTATYGTAPNQLAYIYEPIWLDARTIVNGRIGIEYVELGKGTLRSSLWVRPRSTASRPSSSSSSPGASSGATRSARRPSG